MKYIFTFIILLFVEIAIATYEFYPIIRGFIGDVLVIPLLYFFVRIFSKLPSEKLLLWILFFAFGIELFQFYTILETLNMHSKVLSILIGSTYDPWDFVAYILGFFAIIFTEKLFRKENKKNI